MEESALLPPEVVEGLNEFLTAAQEAFDNDMVSVVLFGSAAEGRLRSVSDVNLLLLLRRFDPDRADRVREPLRAAHAAIRLEVMFLLESEMEPAMDAFAVKFSDILGRRRVLFGPDPFAATHVPPEALRRRTAQVLLNLLLRMRERYVLVSLREEQLAHVAAEMAGPLRACVASVLFLEGRPAPSPREAFACILAEPGAPGGPDIVALMDRARREGSLPPGAAGPLLLSLMELADYLRRRLDAGGESC